MRTATIPELTGVIEGIGVDSIRKALRQLEIHGYVIKAGTRAGHHRYEKSRRIPLLPPVCGACGAGFAAKTCDPLFKEKERERERKKEEAARAEQGRARVAEMVARVNDLYDAPRLPEGPVAPREIPAELKTRLERRLNGDDEEAPDDAA